VTALRPPASTANQTPDDSKAQRLPIIIAAWPHNNHEIIRVTLDRFSNHFTIDVRRWWHDDGGILRPSRDGLTLSVKHLPALANGLVDALWWARTFGLIETATKDQTVAERQRRFRKRYNGGVTS
jgi:hypothetical protein